MRIPRRTAIQVAGWTTAAVLGAGVATGASIAFASGPQAVPQAAFAPSDSPSPSPSPSGSAAPGQPSPDQPGPGERRRHGPFGGPGGRIGDRIGGTALHGEFVVKDSDGKVVTKVTQHGSVTAVSATSISLKSEDGFTATYTVGTGTKVNVGGSSAAITGVKTGNDAWVLATKSGSTSTADNLIVRTK
jgi:hypothetical protein